MIDGLTTGKPENEEQNENEVELATIVGIGENGLVLQFDGEEEKREKNYRCNSGVKFAVGDRVKIHKTSGTYIVEYALGNPNSRVPIGLPSGGNQNQILRRSQSGYYWSDETVEIPSGGRTGQVLTKTNSGQAWSEPESQLPSGGSAGQVLTKTSSGAAWSNPPTELPSGGSAGQVLTKTSSGVSWGNVATPSKISNGNYNVEVTNYGEVIIKSNKIGFFGTYPVLKQTLSTSATLSQLIQALKNYGLV